MLSLFHKVPPLRERVSLQLEFKCLIFCVSRSASVCTLKGLDSNKWDKKINRRQCMKYGEWMCGCACAWMQIVCVCVCVQLESQPELSCSGPRPNGIEQGMKEKDKRRVQKKVKEGDRSLCRAEHCSLDHSQNVVCVCVFILSGIVLV